MDRTACVDIRGLPLQLLLQQHPDWKDKPVVVVDRDKPQGIILWANEAAMDWRIFPGMRYAAGLALSSELRGGVMSEDVIQEAVAGIAQRLWAFSPRIEPSSEEPGVFWLDASGLRHIYPSLEGWADQISDDLREMGFRAIVAVGFSRFGSYAAARAGKRNFVFRSAGQERAAVRRVPIERLGMPPDLRDLLYKFGIETLGGFIDLPPAGIRKRFGAEAAALHSFARGEGWAPLNPSRLFEPLERHEMLEFPEDNMERLLFILDGLLQPLLRELGDRHERVQSLTFSLKLYDESELHEHVAPATPTLDARQLLMLIHLRLSALTLTSPVVALVMRAEGVGAAEGQLSLIQDVKCDREAVHRAFARLRAEFGNDAVVYAQLQEGHLPEAQYKWEPMNELPVPSPSENAARPLVRRIYSPPIELPPRDRREPDGWMVAGVTDGPVDEVIGPQVVSGGWWVREVEREYHYVRTRNGRWLWIYHDRKRRRWFLQGEVQ